MLYDKSDCTLPDDLRQVAGVQLEPSDDTSAHGVADLAHVSVGIEVDQFAPHDCNVMVAPALQVPDVGDAREAFQSWLCRQAEEVDERYIDVNFDREDGEVFLLRTVEALASAVEAEVEDKLAFLDEAFAPALRAYVGEAVEAAR